MTKTYSIAVITAVALALAAFVAVLLPDRFASAAGSIFHAPLSDSGNGAVNTIPATGSGVATFIRATAATSVLSNGALKIDVPLGVARSNYKSDGAYLGYLAEGERYNFVLKSDTDMADGTFWGFNDVNMTATLNAVTSPDGASTADTINWNSGVNANSASNIWLWAFTGTYDIVHTVYAKTSSGTKNFRLAYIVNGPHVNSGDFAANTSWQRVSWLQSISNTGFGIGYVIKNGSDGTTGSIDFWGAQEERDVKFASSYIPSNPGNAGNVGVRNMDVLQYQASGNVATNNETIYLEWAPVSTPNLMGTVFLLGSYIDANNYTAILHDGTNIIARKRIAGVNYDATKALSYAALKKYRIAARFSSASGIDIFVDGAKGANHPNTANLQLGSNFQVGADGNSANSGWGNFRNVMTFGFPLSDEQVPAIGGCAPVQQRSSSIQVSTCNSGTITNLTTSKSSTGGNSANGSIGGKGGSGGDVSSSGSGGNGGATLGNGGKGGNGGPGGAVRTGKASSTAETVNTLNFTRVRVNQ